MTAGPRVAVVFPGQGSLRPGMVERWESDPAARSVLDEAAAHLGPDEVRLWRDPGALTDPVVAQLAGFVLGVAAYASLRQRGLTPVVLAGHSLGEYVALAAGGACRFADLLAVVARRAELMAEAGHRRPGAMAALIGPAAGPVGRSAAARCRPGTLVVANENSPTQVVVSGTADAVQEARGFAAAAGLRTVRLPVAGAFHSPLMQGAADRFAAVLDTLSWSVPAVPVIPNVDPVPTRDPARLADLLRRQMTSPVRWTDTSRALTALDLDAVVECGATPTLGPLVRQVHPSLPTYLLTGPDTPLPAPRPVTASAAATAL